MKNLILILTLLIVGCVSTSAYKFSSKFSNLNLGMTKNEVKETLGPPEYFRASSRINNKLQETWQYTNYAIPHGELIARTVTYWIIFEDNKLIFYGFPGDFGSSAPEIRKEITIKER